jgi:hypothetical protein
VTVCDTCGTSDCPMHTPRVRRVTTQPDTDAPPTHTPGCSLSTAEASGHNRCGCWCHAGPPFRYMPDEVAAVLRPDLGRCHRETCEHGHVDHRPRNECRWCDCKAFVPSVAPQEGRPTGDDDPRTIEQQMIDGDRLPVPPYRPSEGRPITPPVHNHGPEEGPGLRCRERLTGDCLRSVLDVERLAELLVLSGFIARYQDYAHRAHPTTMAREDPTDIARSWAADILAAAPPEASER